MIPAVLSTGFRVCSLVVGAEGRTVARRNPDRYALAHCMLGWAAGNGASLVVFPAGYLRAKSSAAPDVLAAAKEVLDSARKHCVSVLVGVDTSSLAWQGKRDADDVVRRGALPFFAIGWSPGMRRCAVWQQRSTRPGNSEYAPAKDDVFELGVGQRRVGVAVCGDAFSRSVREGLIRRGVDIVAVLAHTAHGSRHPRTLAELSGKGVPVIRAVHAHGWAVNALWLGGLRTKPIIGPYVVRIDRAWAGASIFSI